MSSRNEGESGLGAFLAGFIIGGLVGAAVALVMAPQSGEETRTQLAERSVEWRNYVDENRNQWAENVTQAGRNASSALGGIDLNSFTGKNISADNEENESSA